MSTVKISQLPAITELDTNTITTKLVALDSNTGVTGRITVQTLGKNLYSGDDVLNIGNNITFSDGTKQVTSPAATATYANAAFGVANTANTRSISAELYANGAFIQSNAAFITANAAFIQSNAAFITANTPSHVANSAALYANGAFIKANAAFLMANTPSETANAAMVHAQQAFLAANTPSHVANSAALYANGAFIKANNALANTTGTFDGSLYISESLSVNGRIILSNSNFNSTESALLISATANVTTPAADGYMIHISGKDGVPSKVISDSYGTGSYSVFACRTARGNVDYPSAAQTGDILGRFSAGGFGTTKFQTLGTGRIDFVATENFTDTTTGSQIKFWNCPTGSNTLTNILTLNGDSAQFTGVVNPQKGFIFTPRIPNGDQTAITVDYSTDSMIKANLAADLTISHTNFTAGKSVELWLVNTSGTGRTVTHGLASLNSTTNSTTFNIPATSCAHIRFFSIDGDLANTFVKVTHA